MAIYDILPDTWDDTFEYWDGVQPRPININTKISQTTVESIRSLATVVGIPTISADTVWSNTENNWGEDLEYWGVTPTSNKPKPIYLSTVSTIKNISTD